MVGDGITLPQGPDVQAPIIVIFGAGTTHLGGLWI
jgi:hypothetical protein